MLQYIDKSTVIAEIERIKKEECPTDTYEGRCKLLWFEQFLSFINSLEVKEVDLETELNIWRHNHFHGRRDKEASGEYLKRNSQLDLAKYFFELGLKAKGE